MAETPTTKYDNEPLPTYTNDDRPDASTVTIGLAIWNLDDNAPNYSDGENWRDAQGHIT